MGKQSPKPPDFQGIAQQQVKANRPNQNTAYAQTSWDGDTQNTGFSGPLGGLNESLMGQAAGNAQPMDWGQFGEVGTGDQARQQAIDASYGQATSRLDPQWQQREAGLRTQLLNQGLGDGTEAYNNAFTNLGRERNDAYGSAMNSAQMMGQSAGDSAFRNNMAGRQQSISEALRKRSQPMDEMGQLASFLRMPGFNQANEYLPAATAQYQGALNKYQSDQGFWGDVIGGLFGLGGKAVGAFATPDGGGK